MPLHKLQIVPIMSTVNLCDGVQGKQRNREEEGLEKMQARLASGRLLTFLPRVSRVSLVPVSLFSVFRL